MPTLRMIGVHPEVCARLFIQPKHTILFQNRRDSVNNSKNNTNSNHQTVDNNATKQEPKKPRHRIPTPDHVVNCDIDALRMMDETGTRAIPVPLTRAKRLREEISQALNAYNLQHRSASFDSDSSLSNKRPRQHQEEEETTLVGAISTACPNLDQLLAISDDVPPPQPPENRVQMEPNQVSRRRFSYGIPFGKVTHLSGPPACGKSQFLLHMLCRAYVSHPATTTCWLLSTSPVKPHATRLANMVEQMNGVPPSTKRAIFNKTVLQRVADEWEILACLNELERCLAARDRQEQHGNHQHQHNILLVDSLGPYQFHRQVVGRIATRLRYLARVYSVAILVVESTAVAGGSLSHRHFLQKDKHSRKHSKWRHPEWKSDICLSLRRMPPGPHSNSLSMGQTKEPLCSIRVILEQHPSTLPDNETGPVVQPTKYCTVSMTPQGFVPSSM